MFDIILSLPISLTHLIASSNEGSDNDTPCNHTNHVDSREHLQQTVESFLSIVPPDICSAVYEESGDLGYNTYLLEAQTQVSVQTKHLPLLIMLFVVFSVSTTPCKIFSYTHSPAAAESEQFLVNNVQQTRAHVRPVTGTEPYVDITSKQDTATPSSTPGRHSNQH